MAFEPATWDRFLSRLYSNFILRDLTFILSGGIVLSVAVTKPMDFFLKYISDDKSLNWLAVVAFLGISYILGVLLQEIVRVFLEPYSRGWIQITRNRSESADELVVSLEALSRNCSEYTMNGIERVLFLKQVAATQLATFLAVTIALAYRHDAILLHAEIRLLIFVAVALCTHVYADKSAQQDNILHSLLPPR